MSVDCYFSLKAKLTEAVEEIHSCAKELNKEYNLLLTEDEDGPYGLEYIAEGIYFTVPGSASEEIRRFRELVQRIVKSHPGTSVVYSEEMGYTGHIYYSRNGELIEYIPATMCLCVESDENYEALKDVAAREIETAGFDCPMIDDRYNNISWEYIMDNEESTKKAYDVLSAISSCLNRTPIACYVYKSQNICGDPEYYCIALDGQFEWQESNDPICILHSTILYNEDEIPISIVQLFTDPMKTFEVLLDFVRSRYMDRNHIYTVEQILYYDQSRKYIGKLKSDDKKWLLPYLKLDSQLWDSIEKQEAISAYCDTHDEKLLDIIYGE